ncbi:hypothetical protein HDU83_006033 [Entophlyctis luteolus]|nr:hypothetical protein HDU83_006033 [Entophlyctis luteolus]
MAARRRTTKAEAEELFVFDHESDSDSGSNPDGLNGGLGGPRFFYNSNSSVPNQLDAGAPLIDFLDEPLSSALDAPLPTPNVLVPAIPTIPASNETQHPDLIDVFSPLVSQLPISPNDVTLNIAHDRGSLEITVGELMARLERVEKLQTMFNDLEHAYKKLSRHNTRLNEIIIENTVLSEGVSVGDESSLSQFQSILSTQKSQFLELTISNERQREELVVLNEKSRKNVLELDTKSKEIESLQAEVFALNEQMRGIKATEISSESQSTSRRGSGLATDPISSTRTTNGPVQATLPAATTPAPQKQSPTSNSPSSIIATTSSFFSTFRAKAVAATTPTTQPTNVLEENSQAVSSESVDLLLESPETEEEVTAKDLSAGTTLQLKFQIRQLTAALRKASDERDRAVSKVKDLQQHNHSVRSRQNSAAGVAMFQRHNSLTLAPATASEKAWNSDDGESEDSVDELVDAARRSSKSVLVAIDVNASNIPESNSTTTRYLLEMADSTVFPTSDEITKESSERSGPDSTIASLRLEIEALTEQNAELVEANKKLRSSMSATSSIVRKRASFTAISAPSRTGSIDGVNDAQVSGLEGILLEKEEIIKSLNARIATIAKDHQTSLDTISSLETRISEVESERVRVQKELDTVDERNAQNLDAMAAVNEVTVKSLESDVENHKRMLNTERELVQKLREQIKSLVEEKLNLQVELKGAEAQKRAAVSASQGAIDGHVAANNAKKKAVEEAELAKAQLKEVEKKLSETLQSLSGVTMTRDEHAKQIKSDSELLKSLKEELEVAQANHKEAVTKTEKAFAIIRKLKTEAEMKTKEHDDLEKDVIAARANLQRAQDQMKNMESELEKSKNQISVLENDVLILRASSSSTENLSENALVTHDAAALNEQYEERIKSLQLRVDELMSFNESLRAATKKSDDESISDPLSEPTVACTHENVEALKETIESLRSQLRAVVPKEMTLSKELDQTKATLEETKVKFHTLRDLNKDMDAKLAAAQVAQQEAVNKTEKAFAVVRKMKNDSEMRQKEVDQMKVKHSEELEAANNALRKAELELDSLKGEMLLGTTTSENEHELKSKVDELNSENEKLSGVRRILESRVSALESQLNSKSVNSLLVEADTLSNSEITRSGRTPETNGQIPDSITSDKQFVELSTRLKLADEALSVAKASIASHSEELLAKENEINQIKSKLSEEEEKKNKSIQLLRNMKAKILKLEDMVQSRDTELVTQRVKRLNNLILLFQLAVRGELSDLRSNASTGVAERDIKLLNLTKQVDELTMRIRKQNDDIFLLEKQNGAKNAETEEANSRVKEMKAKLERAVAERDSLQEAANSSASELGSLRGTFALQTNQVSQLGERIKDLEERIATLDEELETSKRLFESKSIEHEQLKLRTSELEKLCYEAERNFGSNTDEVDALRREIMQLRRDVAKHAKTIRDKENSLLAVKQEKDVVDEMLVRNEKECEGLKAELVRLRQQMDDFIAKEEEWKAALHQMELLKSGKEHEILTRTEGLRSRCMELEKVVDDCKARESHLLKLNKSLKDEVRKLARSIGISTPLTSPPLSHQNSGVDQSEVALANTNSPAVNDVPRSSLSSQFDLSGSSSMANNPQTAGSPIRGSAPFFLPLSRKNSASSLNFSSTSAKLPPNEEYLKNVVLRFVESKRDTKMQMIPALGVLLRLTPEEMKRVQRCI